MNGGVCSLKPSFTISVNKHFSNASFSSFIALSKTSYHFLGLFYQHNLLFMPNPSLAICISTVWK